MKKIKENMVYMHNGVLVTHKEHDNICRKMYGTAHHHVKQNKSDSEI